MYWCQKNFRQTLFIKIILTFTDKLDFNFAQGGIDIYYSTPTAWFYPSVRHPVALDDFEERHPQNFDVKP